MKQAKKFILLVLLLWLGQFAGAFAHEDPNAILDQIRFAQARITKSLTGRLRPEDGVSIPLQLQLKGSEIDYQFSNPPETLKLQLTN